MKWVKLLVLAGIAATLFSGSVLAQGIDLFDATVLEDGTLLIQHLNSYHNCCIPVTHEVDVVDQTIFVTEIEPYITGCWCYCYFDMSLEISDLPPGNFSIEYTYDIDENIHTSTWVTEVFSVHIPGQITPREVPESQSTQSACHGGGSVENVPIGLDKIKSFYR